MSQPAPEQHHAEQQAREVAATQISDVLLNLEHTVARARKGLKRISADGVDVNAELALAEAIKDLEKVRKRLTQDTYFAADARLI